MLLAANQEAAFATIDKDKLTGVERSSASLDFSQPGLRQRPGAPYLPGFGRCGIPQTSTPDCAGC